MKRYTVLLALILCLCFSNTLSQSSWTITQKLDTNGKYNVTRHVFMEEKVIVFEVSVETTGFVGFGLSYTGDMTGADIVIGGVNADSTTYFTDRHATSRSMPLVDNSQDWFLEFGTEKDGKTVLRFNRTFSTCDDDDIPISDDTLKIIWSYGLTDEITYHQDRRGIVSVNLLDPPQPSPDLSGLKKWPVLIEDTMPTQDTSYWCSIHTTPPEMTHKTFLVGFEAELPSKIAEFHTHHFIFSKCTVPNEDVRQILEGNLNKPGRDCRDPLADNPKEHCTLYMFVWAKGGEVTMFPENVGYPIKENSDKEYYMLEIHYDNPDVVDGVRFETGLTIYYDDDRSIEAGLLVVGHEVWFPHTIPPNSKNFMTLGHCPGVCTQWAFPENGINIFNVLLHSHLSGRRLKVRHIRDGEELPWIASDDNYDFNYQQNRPLRKELVVLPGDHLIYECITDTTWKDGKLTIGDLGTSDEMCETFLFYYPRIQMDNCLTMVDVMNVTFPILGIEGIRENPDDRADPLITGPESMVNRTYVDALENVVDWTPEIREKFQYGVRFEDQQFFCGKAGSEDYFMTGTIAYPDIKEDYQPEDACPRTPSWNITQTLDTLGKYNVTRFVYMEEGVIEFEVSVETTGFVGFGLSYTGDMTGADIVIGGVNADSTTYFTDRHATGRTTPIVDQSQDWFLISAEENDGITKLKFSREFITCDDEDIPINDDTLKMIWSYGSTDDIVYHGTNRGVASVNLLDPPQPSPDLSLLQEWSVVVNDTMPTQDTSYWCSFHTTPPEMTKKTYLVGYNAELHGELAEYHTHHFLFYKCAASNQAERDILAGLVGQPGRDCQAMEEDHPRRLCQRAMFVWAKGGEITMFPDNVGFPVMESSENEYYMLEIHYDNPKEESGLSFETGIKIFYDDTRTIEAGILVVGHQVNFVHTIPPNSINFMTMGQCPSECFTEFLPETGINVFNILLHSHLSGRRLKTRLFRDGQELPWIASDDNYDFNYQQNRPLRQELRLLRGDHLLYECVTDTTWKDGELTIGDLSTTDEMCETFMFYYPRIEMDTCLSAVEVWNGTFPILGIEMVAENPLRSNNPIITAPSSMFNMTYIDALEKVVDWNPERRRAFQEAVIFNDQHFICGSSDAVEEIMIGMVKYPHVDVEYTPFDPCSVTDTTGTSSTPAVTTTGTSSTPDVTTTGTSSTPAITTTGTSSTPAVTTTGTSSTPAVTTTGTSSTPAGTSISTTPGDATISPTVPDTTTPSGSQSLKNSLIVLIIVNLLTRL